MKSIVLSVLAVICSASSVYAVGPYHLTDLGALPESTYSVANAINANGDVVGFSIVGVTYHAVLWTSQGGMQDLGVPSDSIGAYATGINSIGKIAGNGQTSTLDNVAFEWSSGSGISTLGGLVSGLSTAAAINLQGHIAGDSNYSQAFLWKSTSDVTYLGTLFGGASRAMAVNDSDQVAGTEFVAQDTNYAFRWTSSGGMQDLGSLSANIHDSSANGINAKGHVVGSAAISNGVIHAFLWTEQSGMKDLGDLPNGFDESVALGVNATDEVVGYSTLSSFIWTSNGGMQNLEDLLDDSGSGWLLYQANAINDAGQIVGRGANPDGDIHAFLLTPVPEPAGAALLAIGSFFFIRCPRRILSLVATQRRFVLPYRHAPERHASVS